MTTRRGRLLLAYLVVLLTAGTASLLSSGSAGAETVATTRRVTAANWYWRAQVVSPVDGSPVLHDPGEGDHGDTLVVAGPNADGEPDRFSVLKMDLVGLPPAASLRRALLVLPLSGSVGVPTTGTPADPTVEDAPVLPSLVVCTARGSWSDGPGGRPWSEAPAVDCTTRARALPGADNRYRVDVSDLLPALAGGQATGLALVPDLDQPAAYELRFGPRADIGLDVLYDRQPPTTSRSTTTTTAAGPPTTEAAPPVETDVPSTFAAPVDDAPDPSSPVPSEPVAEVEPQGTLGPAPFDFEPVAAIRAPLAVFVLFAVVGLLGLLFLSPSMT